MNLPRIATSKRALDAVVGLYEERLPALRGARAFILAECQNLARASSG